MECFENYVPTIILREVYDRKFESIFYKKSKETINKYKNKIEEVDLFINDINSEYKSIEKEIKDFLF